MIMTAELPIEQRTLDGVEGGVYVRPSGPVRGPSGVAFRDHIARILTDSGQQIDLLDLEDQFILVSELLQLATGDHLAYLVFALVEDGADFLDGVEHLVHV